VNADWEGVLYFFGSYTVSHSLSSRFPLLPRTVAESYIVRYSRKKKRMRAKTRKKKTAR
jgi:hypothetical protein